MATARDDLGLRGEKLAEKELRRRGLKLVARRYRVPGGELDLICTEKQTVVFVEVKTQSDRDLIDPEQRVNTAKRARMIRAAKHFVCRYELLERPCRFDVVAVTLDADGSAQIEWFPDAFVPRRW